MHRLKTALVRAVPFLVALAVALVAVAVAAPPGQTLVVEDVDTGEHYITHSVDNGSTLTLSYTHSVEKSRVDDIYRVSGTTLVNTRMEFGSYGWGLPSRVNVTNVNGTLVYDPPGPITTLDQLVVSPGRIADHELTVGSQTYRLVAETNGKDVRIHIEQQSLTDLFP
jgi:hypothetical protein